MNCDNFSELYSFHPGGCVLLFGDGSADLVSEDIDVDTFISLFTASADDIPGVPLRRLLSRKFQSETTIGWTTSTLFFCDLPR